MSNIRIALIAGAIVLCLGLFAAAFIPDFAECRLYAGWFHCLGMATGLSSS